MAADKGKGKWKVTTIDCGYLLSKKVNLVPAGGDPDLIVSLPDLAFLLQDGEKNILIDNGRNERYLIDGKGWGGFPAFISEQKLLDSLAAQGLKPQDIDAVIYTHLHNDHAGNCHLFMDATAYCQEEEWDNLLNPCPAELPRRDFDFDIIPYLKQTKGLIKIDGDCELMEGIRVVKTPGHTRGSQSVIVNTTNGLRAFIGDLCHLECMAFPQSTELMNYEGEILKITPGPKDWMVMPSSLVYNYYEFYRSIDKVRAIVPEWNPGYIVFGHDAKYIHEPI